MVVSPGGDDVARYHGSGRRHSCTDGEGPSTMIASGTTERPVHGTHYADGGRAAIGHQGEANTIDAPCTPRRHVTSAALALARLRDSNGAPTSWAVIANASR